MKGAGAHPAIADVGNRDDLFLLHSTANENSGHHRYHVAEMRDWSNKTLLHIAKMNVEIPTAGRPPGLCHVLGKNITRSYSFYEHCAEIANQWRNEVTRLQRVRGTDRCRFLAQRTKATTDNLCLAIKVY